MKSIAVALGLTGIVFLTGCSLPNDCDWAQPIRPTQNDVVVISDTLVNQLVVHNDTGKQICGWRE